MKGGTEEYSRNDAKPRSHFTTRDLALIGVTAGVLVVIGFFTGRLGRIFVLGLPISGTHGLASGFFDAFLGVIAAAKIRKTGALTLVGIVENIIKVLVGKPVYAVGPAIAGFAIADLLMRLSGHRFCCVKCIWPVGGVLLGSRFVLKVGMFYVLGMPALKIIQAHPFVTLWVLFLSVLIGTLGSLFGSTVVKELRKAGLTE